MQTNNNQDSAISLLPTENSQATRVFKLMNRLAADELKRYKREQLLFFPFFVTDSQLEEFSKEIIKELKNIEIIETIDFIGSVRFEDLSSQRFDSFEQFIDRAGKRKDPESIKLAWSKFAIDNKGEAISGQVELSFMTEKQLKTGRNNQNNLPQAKIEIVVSGSDQKWVDQLFDDLVPVVKTTAHGGIMRPLWIFQKDWVVQIIGGIMALAAVILLLNIGEKYYTMSNERASQKVLKAVNAAAKLEDKFSYYVNWTLGPKPNPFPEIVVIMVSVVLSAFTAFYITVKCVPYLTPSSAIAIGNAKRRALSSVDVFKFIVFTVIIGGLIIPVLRALIVTFWTMMTSN